jgi:hypothetical protein
VGHKNGTQDSDIFTVLRHLGDRAGQEEQSNVYSQSPSKQIKSTCFFGDFYRTNQLYNVKDTTLQYKRQPSVTNVHLKSAEDILLPACLLNPDCLNLGVCSGRICMVVG